MTYLTPPEGSWFSPVRKGWFMRCCDCSLVHRIRFRTVKGQIQMQVFRDERKTAANRRERRRREHA